MWEAFTPRSQLCGYLLLILFADAGPIKNSKELEGGVSFPGPQPRSFDQCSFFQSRPGIFHEGLSDNGLA